MSEEQLRKELNASFKNRAILYYLIFDECVSLANHTGAHISGSKQRQRRFDGSAQKILA
jgi:hypothetical protein